MSDLPLKITKKNGSKKIDRRKRFFLLQVFSDAAIELKDDNFGKVAD